MANNENLSNSIWPNGIKTDSEGYAIFYPLGTNKTSVPSTAEEWPAGDKLISPFVYQDDKLVGFCDTKAMTVSDKTSITLNYEHIEADFSSIEEGMLTITAPNATTTKYVWANSSSSDTGNSGDTVVLGTKYINCSTLDDVKAIEPDYLTNDIIDGAWTQSLANLTNGDYMFESCSKLTSFTSNLSSLKSGMYMFAGCSNLITFHSDLSSLLDAGRMFIICSNLTSFSSDLSSLTNGWAMFYNCSNLTSFSSNLSNLEDGLDMFQYCKLDTASVQNIADTINTSTSGGMIDIGIGNSTPNEQEKAAFNTIASKGWIVYININGRDDDFPWIPTATTPIDGEQTVTPIPFYAKPVQSDEQRAHYVDKNGNYYNILGGNYVYGDDLSTYGMFTSEEDAAANMRLTKIERN